MTRTQSGSFISDLSKQPTPAPSVEGSDEEDEAGDFPYTEDQSGNGAMETEETLDSRHSTTNVLATPAATPARGPPMKSQLKEAQLISDVRRYKSLVEDLKKAADVHNKTSADKVGTD